MSRMTRQQWKNQNAVTPKVPKALRKTGALPIVRVAPKIGRNQTCPCGSGKKFKNCHLAQLKAVAV